METHRNRDRLSTLIQKLWSVQKSTRPFQSIKVLNTYSKAQRNQWESGHWIQQDLEHTQAGRELSPAEPAAGNSELTAASFGGVTPLLPGSWEGSSAGVPAVGTLLGNCHIRHCTTPIQLCTSRPIFHLFHLGPGGAADGQPSTSNTRKALQGGQLHQDAATWENQDLSTLIGEHSLLVIFWLFFPI